MDRPRKWLFLFLASLAVVYSVIVLVFVATSPDIGLRCLLVDDAREEDKSVGVQIKATLPDLQYKGALPSEDDLLFRIGEEPIRTFIDFSTQLISLRNARIQPGGDLYAGADPSEHADMGLPSLVKEDEKRWVKIEFRDADTTDIQTSWLLVQLVPFDEVVLTFVWFVLELGIFLVGAFAYWNRPFDRPAALFFAMCIVTMCAFVGGFHWWVIAGSLVLNVPFVVCAILVPVVTLHFFLIYPRAKPPLSRWPRLTVGGMYAVPLATVVGALALVAYTHWWNAGEPADQHAEQVSYALDLLKRGIYAYVLCVASLYFLLTIVALVYSFFTTRNAIERNQVKWILWAGLIATIPVGYSLYLACFDRVGFALGKARIPMFLASLLFMLAYAVGIVRYKLMLVDQIVSKGMLYYVVTFGLTLAFSTAVALGGVVHHLLNISLDPLQLLAVFAILLLSVILLLWLRDEFQQMIDRRFFREKYQLDKALERMNRAVGHLLDPASLAAMMLGSCRDVLRVERAALYLRTSRGGPFQLVAAEGTEQFPLQCPADSAVDDALRQSGSLQRVTVGSRSEISPVQNLLRHLQADLVHALEVDEVIAGLVVLGGKRAGASFTAEDLTFLTAMGQITNVALHSAKVHQDVTRLNEELRLKAEKIGVQRRTIAMLQAELTSTQTEPRTSAAPVEANDFRRDAIKGNSPAIRSVLEMVRKVASSESSVLIRGESGTGKQLLTQVLHDNSARRNRQMIDVHCASLSPSLLESELFGHVKGAFTGAHRDKIGRFEAANGGTLFLDEIGDIPLDTQIKLLRVLQERRFEPVGSTRTIHVDVRLITATHQNLEKLISEGRFREDLYYRLNVISITLPPLRERKEDMIELAFFFLNRAARRMGKRVTRIEEDALVALERHVWPGNIRELENAIERAVVLAEGEMISSHDLPAEITQSGLVLPSYVVETKPAQLPAASAASWSEPPQKTNARIDSRSERERLLNALQECGGNKAQAARMLDMPRSTYFSKLKRYGLG